MKNLNDNEVLYNTIVELQDERQKLLDSNRELLETLQFAETIIERINDEYSEGMMRHGSYTNGECRRIKAAINNAKSIIPKQFAELICKAVNERQKLLNGMKLIKSLNSEGWRKVEYYEKRVAELLEVLKDLILCVPINPHTEPYYIKAQTAINNAKNILPDPD